MNRLLHPYLLASILFPLSIHAGDTAKLQNGSFRDGLSQWEVFGDVSPFSEQALLRDVSSNVSSIHQAIRMDGGDVRVDFQFLNLLSGNRPFGTLLDTVSATLFFVEDGTRFDFTTNTFRSATRLFDIDADGISGATGTFEASDFRSGWTAYSAVVPADGDCAVLAIEFFNLNGVTGDSRFFVDWLSVSSSDAVCSPVHLQIENGETELNFTPIQGFSNVVETTETVELEDSWVTADHPLADLETYREPLDPLGPEVKFFRVLFNRNDGNLP